MKSRLAVGFVAGIGAVLIAVATSRADPNLNHVTPHRHWVKTSAGLVEVGPRVCDNPDLQRAFDQFHNNIHIATGSSIGPAAPGLHNFKGADLQASGC